MSTVIRDCPGRLTERTSFISDIFWISDSNGSDTSRATCAALAPGYSVTTTAVLMVKAGSSNRPRVKNPQIPPSRAASMISHVRIGRSMEAFAIFMAQHSVRESGEPSDAVPVCQLARPAGDDFLARLQPRDHAHLTPDRRLDGHAPARDSAFFCTNGCEYQHRGCAIIHRADRRCRDANILRAGVQCRIDRHRRSRQDPLALGWLHAQGDLV